MNILIDIKSNMKRISIVVNDNKKEFKINGKHVDVDIDDFIFKICDITMQWPEKLINKSIVDGNRVKIIIKDKSFAKEMKFINKFPNNFSEFQTLVNEVLNVEKQLSRNI